MNAKKALLAIAFLTLSASAAAADQNPKWYVGGAIGKNWVKDFDLERRTTVGAFSAHAELDVEMKSDTSYSGVFGYRYTDEWSVQGEWSHRSNKSDSVKVGNTSLQRNDVRLKSDAFMANAIYTVQGLGAIRPYAGVGIGTARVSMDKDDTLGGADDATWAFAYQGLLGAEVSLSRQWLLYGQYQYFRTSKDLTVTSARGTTSNRYELDSYPANQSFSVGVKYNF